MSNSKFIKQDFLEVYAPLIYQDVPDLKPGTFDYEQYWDKIDEYCKYGYKPKGDVRPISNKHFWYLNIWKIKLNPPGTDVLDDRKVLGTPWYRDMDHMYFDLIDSSKKNRHGGIVLKARDKGFSMMNAGSAGHEYTLYPQNEIGIAAGLQVTADSFYTKVKDGLDNIQEEYQLSVLQENQSIRKSGYKKKSKAGGWVDSGTRSAIHVRTMNNPNVFKGERLGLMIFEEAGEFTKLIEGYSASKACFMDGSNQFGVPLIGGTGGDIEKSSKDFKAMWNEYNGFNLKRLFIPASYVYSGFFDFSTGLSSIEKAEKHLLAERRLLKGDAYFLHVQNYPLTEEEAFIKTKNGALDLAKINKQIITLKEEEWAQGIIERGELDWDFPEGFQPSKNPKRRLESIIRSGAKVKWRSTPDGNIQVYKHPEEKYKGLDIGGVDSIDQDDSGVKSSDGAIVIYRRFANMSKEYNMPIAILKFRSDDADDFFEYVIKMAMYWDSKMLVEYTKVEVIKVMERLGLQRYLRERPQTAYDQAETSTTNNRFGVHMYGAIKNYMNTLLKFEVKHNIERIYFLDLLYELADYGTRNTDIAMAYGISLINNDDSYSIEVEYQDDGERKNIGASRFRLEDNGEITEIDEISAEESFYITEDGYVNTSNNDFIF